MTDHKEIEKVLREFEPYMEKPLVLSDDETTLFYVQFTPAMAEVLELLTERLTALNIPYMPVKKRELSISIHGTGSWGKDQRHLLQTQLRGDG